MNQFTVKIFANSDEVVSLGFALPEIIGPSTWAEIRELFKIARVEAESLGLRYYEARFYCGDRLVHKERSLTDLCNVIIPLPDVSSGYSLDGEFYHNGGYTPMLCQRSQGVSEETVSIWHFEVPQVPPFGEDRLTWWPRWFTKYLCKGAQIILTSGQKISVRWDADNRDWLGHLKGAELRPTDKLRKRLSFMSTGERAFVASLAKGKVKIGHLDEMAANDPLLKKLFRKAIADGISFADETFFRKEVLERDNTIVDLPAAYRRAVAEGRDTPQMEQLARAEALRLRQDRIRRALKSRLGSLRILAPTKERGSYKGNVLLVRGLFRKYGVHILSSGWNEKREVLGAGQGRWVIGFEPQYAHTETRTSVQYLLNLPALWPVEDVNRWVDHELAMFIKELVSGELEEKHLVRQERLGSDLPAEDREVASVMFRRRLALENLFLAGLGIDRAPSLALDGYEALCAKLFGVGCDRASIPVPHSIGHIQILASSVAELDNRMVRLNVGEIDVDLDRGYAIVADDELEALLARAGGADEDDHFDLILIKDAGGVYKMIVLRHPNDRGEYTIMTPTQATVNDMVARQSKRIAAEAVDDRRRFTFSESDWPVRQVNLKDLPLQVDDPQRRPTKKLTKEDLVVLTGIEGADLDDKRVYIDGYTLDHAEADVAEARLGHQPGFGINVMMAASSAGIDRVWELPMEGFIDLNMQGGSLLAKQTAEAVIDKLFERLLRHLHSSPSSRKIDITYWESCNFDVPKKMKKKEGINAEDVTSENELTKIYKHFIEARDKSKSLLKVWLSHWQQLPAEWQTLLLEDHRQWEAWRKKTFKVDWKEGAGKAFQALGQASDSCKADPSPEAKEAVDRARKAYEEEVHAYVAKNGIVGLLARIYPGREEPYLLNDGFLWNGTVGDLIFAHYRGGEGVSPEELRRRHGHFVDGLVFRLANSTPLSTAAWVRRSVDRDLIEERHLPFLVKVLRDHASKDGVESLLDVCIDRLVDGTSARIWSPDQAYLRHEVVAAPDVRRWAGEVAQLLSGDDGDSSSPPPSPPSPTPEEISFYVDRLKRESLNAMILLLKGENPVDWDLDAELLSEYAEFLRNPAETEALTDDFSYLWQEILEGAEKDGVGDAFLDKVEATLLEAAKEALKAAVTETRKPKRLRVVRSLCIPVAEGVVAEGWDIDDNGKVTDMHQVRLISTNGKMRSIIAELFSRTEGGVPTHLYVINREALKAAVLNGLKLPDTLETVAYDKGQEPPPG